METIKVAKAGAKRNQKASCANFVNCMLDLLDKYGPEVLDKLEKEKMDTEKTA